MSADEETEEHSPLVGGCVVLVAIGAVLAGVFAASATAGVFAVWVVGALALVRAVTRRMSDSSAPPPSRGVAPESDEAARRRRVKARVAMDPNGVMCIVHAPPEGPPPD
ncbi:hypothetical protein ABZ890_39645 [Streptomyces sp. NPDC046984]|uniref:hypothetical protein n=1 Tax=Streptomyces sp. NPDC046984 TaxID=3155138 RepID=UPI0033CA9C56